MEMSRSDGEALQSALLAVVDAAIVAELAETMDAKLEALEATRKAAAMATRMIYQFDREARQRASLKAHGPK
jgi:hypothetical protein